MPPKRTSSSSSEQEPLTSDVTKAIKDADRCDSIVVYKGLSSKDGVVANATRDRMFTSGMKWLQIGLLIVYAMQAIAFIICVQKSSTTDFRLKTKLYTDYRTNDTAVEFGKYLPFPIQALVATAHPTLELASLGQWLFVGLVLFKCVSSFVAAKFPLSSKYGVSEDFNSLRAVEFALCGGVAALIASLIGGVADVWTIMFIVACCVFANISLALLEYFHSCRASNTLGTGNHAMLVHTVPILLLYSLASVCAFCHVYYMTQAVDMPWVCLGTVITFYAAFLLIHATVIIRLLVLSFQKPGDVKGEASERMVMRSFMAHPVVKEIILEGLMFVLFSSTIWLAGAGATMFHVVA